MRLAAIFLCGISGLWSASAIAPTHPDLQTIINRSVAANERDWNAAPNYSFTERDRDSDGTKTYRVIMIMGSPYYELIARNGNPLPSGERAREEEKLREATAERSRETPTARAHRVAEYQKERSRDHIMLQQLVSAFRFQFVRNGQLNGRAVYVLKASPRPGYQPPNRDSEVLPGMEGTLWIDRDSFEWVKVEAHVVRPVSIEGFLAEVEPGTFFEMDKAPVGGGIWLPSRFLMRSRSKVLHIIPHRDQDDETYFNYRPASS